MARSGLQKRILLYEPSKAIGDDMAAYLGNEGFAVEQVNDPDQAIKLAHRRWYRTIIIIKDLSRDAREREETLKWIDNLPRDIPKIIHADIADYLYPEISKIKATLRTNHEWVEIIPKAEYDQVLEALHAFQTNVHFNYNDDLQFLSTPSLKNPIHHLMGRLEANIADDYESIKGELEDLFRMAFDCRRIEFENAYWESNGRLGVPVHSKHHEHMEERQIVILARRSPAGDGHTTKPVAFPKVIRQITSKHTTHYSLEVNALEGDPDWSHITPIQEVLKHHEWDLVSEAIHQVGDFILDGWQRKHGDIKKPVGDISEVIRHHLQLGQPGEILTALKNQIQFLRQAENGAGIGVDYDGNKLTIHLSDGPIVLSDPVKLAAVFLQEKFPGNLVHVPGRIDLSRILVDPGDSRVWITDLEGQGILPRFWPETDLELDLRGSLDGNFRNRFLFEKEFCSGSDKINLKNIAAEDQSIATVIKHLQEKASQQSESEQKSYHILMIFKILSRFCMVSAQPEQQAQELYNQYHLLVMLALFLNHFLESKWMKFDESLVEKTGVITYDDARDDFIIDNKVFEITETAKRYLKFLHVNSNRFISYVEIGEGVLEDDEGYLRSGNTSLVQQIQQNKSRLQKALAKQSPGWNYFQTKAKGYIFHDPPHIDDTHQSKKRKR